MKQRWSRRALRDLQSLADRIALDKPLAAAEFVSALAARVAMLERQPLMGKPGPLDDTRELVVHKNYLVTHRLRADEIQILQLWHVAQNRPHAAAPKP
jgi:addiction module RelE/StbE family toxin